MQALEEVIARGEDDRDHEHALDLFLGRVTAGYEDVTDLPWTEIDFPEDLARARDVVLPAIQALDAERARA